MWRPHVAHIVPPLALLASAAAAAVAVLAVAAVVAAPFCGRRTTTRSSGPTGTRRRGRAGAAPRALPVRRARDQRRPGLVWRRATGPPGDFADTSFQRIDDDEITAGVAGEGGGRRATCAAWSSSSPTHFGRFRRLCSTRSPPRATAPATSARHHRLYETRRLSIRDVRRPRSASAVTGRDAATRPSGRASAAAAPRSITAAERHQLGGDVQREQHEHHRRAGCSRREPSTTASPSTAPITLAPVSPSMSRSCRSSPSSPNAAPITGATAMPMGAAPTRDRDRHVGDQPELDRAPRRAVEQVAEVGGERDQQRRRR